MYGCEGWREKPGFSSALLLNNPVNGSCFSMYFEEPRRVVFLKTQLLMVLHHPPPYSIVVWTMKSYEIVKPWKVLLLRFYLFNWTLFYCYIPPIEWANCLHQIQIQDASGNQVTFHPNKLALLDKDKK